MIIDKRMSLPCNRMTTGERDGEVRKQPFCNHQGKDQNRQQPSMDATWG